MSKKRAVILNTIIVFSFLLVSLRLADLMIINHERLSARADQQHIKVEDVKVRRGSIFDRRGRELALNLELESLYCDPKQLILDDAVWIPLTFDVENWLVKPYVQNYRVPPIKVPKFQYVSIAEH